MVKSDENVEVEVIRNKNSSKEKVCERVDTKGQKKKKKEKFFCVSRARWICSWRVPFEF